jgi:hypothetical protein
MWMTGEAQRRGRPSRTRCVCLLVVLAVAGALGPSATAGATTVGETAVFSGPASNPLGTAQGYVFTPDDSGTVDRLSFYLDGSNTASGVELGLYSGTTDSATERLGRCVIASPQADAWNSCTITAATVTTGATYWLAYLQPAGSTGTLEYREGVVQGVPTTYASQDHDAASLPAAWSNGTGYARGYRASIYADQSPWPIPPTTPCSDAADNDGDGLSDDPSSTGCFPTTDDDESSPAQHSRDRNCAPAAADTMTNTVSSTCGFADTTNTGVPAGTTLERVPEDITAPDATTGSGWSWNDGGIAVTDGAVVKNIALRAGAAINVEADNVTIQNVRIHGGGDIWWGVQVRHANNVTVEDSEIWGLEQFGPDRCDSAIRDVYGDAADLTVRRVDVWWCSSPLNNITEGGLIEQNYFHDFGFDTTTGTDHTNGIQFEPGSGALMTVRDNTILNEQNQTDAIILSNDGGGPESNRRIDHNLLGGGGYCFYGSGGPGASATRITFSNNHFSRIYYPNCGSFGPTTYWVTGDGNAWSANVWDDTGAPVWP